MSKKKFQIFFKFKAPFSQIQKGTVCFVCPILLKRLKERFKYQTQIFENFAFECEINEK